MSNGYSWADGFDNYTTPSIAYETVSGAPTIGTAYRRFPPPSPLTGQGLNCPQSTYVQKNLPSNQATLVSVFAANPNSLPSSGFGSMWALLDNGTTQVSMAIGSNGSIQFYRSAQVWGGGQVALGSPTAPGLVVPGVWAGYTILATINNGAGVITLYMNGAAAILSLTGLNTQNSANAYANQIRIGRDNVGSGGGAWFDDLVVMDAVGNWFNGTVGKDGRLFTKMPSGAGDLTAWTPVGNANNYACCNEIPPDGDATYVSSAGSTQQDSYAMQTIGLTVAPYGVLARSYVRKDDSSSHTFQNGVRSNTGGGGPTNGLASAVTLSSSYVWYDAPLQNDPNTSTVWTGAGADAAQVLKEATT